jgi:hypothetical protein
MTAVAGIVGPILFAAALLSLTVLQYDFMVGIGWQPWRDPAGAWPSGLALGPYGWAQTASFIVSGVLLMIFATGLHLGVTGGLGSRAGPGLLLVSGTAMALMGFETDPIRRTGGQAGDKEGHCEPDPRQPGCPLDMMPGDAFRQLRETAPHRQPREQGDA